MVTNNKSILDKTQEFMLLYAFKRTCLQMKCFWAKNVLFIILKLKCFANSKLSRNSREKEIKFQLFQEKKSSKISCILAWSMHSKNVPKFLTFCLWNGNWLRSWKTSRRIFSLQRDLASEQVRCVGKGQSSHYRIKDFPSRDIKGERR